jgi:hypothetical protein
VIAEERRRINKGAGAAESGEGKGGIFPDGPRNPDPVFPEAAGPDTIGARASTAGTPARSG